MDQNNILVLRDLGHEVVVLSTSEEVYTRFRRDFPDVQLELLASAESKTPCDGFWQRRLAHVTKLVARTPDSYRVELLSVLERLGRRYGIYRTSFGRLAPSIAQRLERSLRANSFDLLYAFWGLGVFPELRYILDNIPDRPFIVHDMQTYPYGYIRANDNVPESQDVGSVLGRIEGRIFASSRMEQYLCSKFNLSNYGRNLVRLYRFSKRYFRTRCLPKLSSKDGEPHLLSLGSADLDRHPFDNIRPQLRQLCRARIHIHLPDTGNPLWEDPYLHTFPAFVAADAVDGSLATFATQFDACIVLYNVRKPLARFHNSLPARFLFALATGIPIVLPERLFPACEDVVREHSIGFTFRNAKDLATKLQDAGFIAALAAKANSICLQFAAENDGGQLNDFLLVVAGMHHRRSE